MALSQMPFGKPVTYLLTEESALGVTAIEDVRNGACTLHAITARISGAAAVAPFVKIYDNDGSDLTVGTTAPNIIIPIPVGGNAASFHSVTVQIIQGAALTNGLSAVACEEDGNDVTEAPDSDLTVTFTTT